MAVRADPDTDGGKADRLRRVHERGTGRRRGGGLEEGYTQELGSHFVERGRHHFDSTRQGLAQGREGKNE